MPAPAVGVLIEQSDPETPVDAVHAPAPEPLKTMYEGEPDLNAQTL